ncbi:hypothetical protein V1278_002645 [Bradyrhizobium sp. AZCC 1577]
MPGLPDLVRRFPDAPFVSISDDQRAHLGEANWIGTIYHGLPADLFRPSFEVGSYLAFLGRLTAEKEPEAGRLSELDRRQVRMQFEVCRKTNGAGLSPPLQGTGSSDASEVHPGIRPTLAPSVPDRLPAP